MLIHGFWVTPRSWEHWIPHYTAETLTEVKVIEVRSHLLPAPRGWEEIADYALSWAERHVVSLAEHGA